MEAMLKIAALFTYCGGPLLVAGVLKPRLNGTPAFLITFLPVGLMVVGALCLYDDTRSRWSSAAVRAGRLGLYVALGMHAYAVWRFAHGHHVPDQSLHYLGIAVGVAWSVAYLRAARRWGSSVLDPSNEDDRASSKPIEPS
jgi:hypothetical protein